jgi:hypothetical protein
MPTSDQMIPKNMRPLFDMHARGRSRWNRDAQHARSQASQRQAEQDAADARDRRLARGAVPPEDAAKVWAHVEAIMTLWVKAANAQCRATNRQLDQYLREHREFGNLPLELAHEELLATKQVTAAGVRWTLEATQKDRDAAAALASR